MGGNKCNVPVCHHDQCGDGICARPSMCQCPDGSFKKSCNDEDPAHEVRDHLIAAISRLRPRTGLTLGLGLGPGLSSVGDP